MFSVKYYKNVLNPLLPTFGRRVAFEWSSKYVVLYQNHPFKNNASRKISNTMLWLKSLMSNHSITENLFYVTTIILVGKHIEEKMPKEIMNLSIWQSCMANASVGEIIQGVTAWGLKPAI